MTTTQALDTEALEAFQELAGFLLSTPASIICTTFLFGILTVLSLASLYALRYRSPACLQTVAQAIAVLVPYVATGVYFGYTLAYAVAFTEYMGSAASRVGQGSALGAPDTGREVRAAKQWWAAMNAVMLVNGIVGTAVVWWRTCASWTGLRCIRYVAALLLAAMLAVGTASAYSARVQQADDILFVPPGGDASRLRIAFAVLTLGTNITATFLTALKAWDSRERLTRVLSKGTWFERGVQSAELVLESGMGYCVLWIIVVGYEAAYRRASSATWLSTVLYIIGFIAPLLAINPVLVILLVATKGSHLQPGHGPRSTFSPHSRRSFTTGTAGSGTMTSVVFAHLSRPSEIVVPLTPGASPQDKGFGEKRLSTVDEGQNDCDRSEEGTISHSAKGDQEAGSL